MAIPALLTRKWLVQKKASFTRTRYVPNMSSLVSRLLSFCAACTTLFKSARSRGIQIKFSGFTVVSYAKMWSRVLLALAPDRAVKYTLAPFVARCLTVARPIPALEEEDQHTFHIAARYEITYFPPVTRATLPLRSGMSNLGLNACALVMVARSSCRSLDRQGVLVE